MKTYIPDVCIESFRYSREGAKGVHKSTGLPVTDQFLANSCVEHSKTQFMMLLALQGDDLETRYFTTSPTQWTEDNELVFSIAVVIWRKK